MASQKRYKQLTPGSILKVLVLLIVCWLMATPAAFAQNTKGDRPQSSGSSRETRFKGSKKKKVKSKQSYNRVQSRKSSRSNRAQSSRPQKIHSQKSQFVNNSSRTVKDQKRNLKSSDSYSRVAGSSSSSQRRNVYPQRGRFVNNPSRVPDSKPPKVSSNKSTVRVNSNTKSIGSKKNVYKQKGAFVNNPSRVPNDKPRLTKVYPPGYRRVKSPPKDAQQKWRAVSTKRVAVRSVSGRTRNTFSQKGPYVNNPSRSPQRTQKVVSNTSQVAKLKRTTTAGSIPPGKGKRVRGASASRPYISHRSINAFAGFWNQKPSKGDKPYTRGDLAGHKIRGKNYQTKIPVLVNPTANPYKPKKSKGDQVYKGPAAGKYKSVTKTGKAWTGDIAGRKIRGRNYSSKRTVGAGQPIFPPKKSKRKIGDTPYKGTIPGGGYQSASQKRKGSVNPLPGKMPGDVANRIDGYQGSMRGAGKSFSPGGALFSGNMKSRKPLKGGGSVSGKMWNNRNQPIVGRGPTKTDFNTGAFSGNIKSGKPLKGGGSVSGKMWNNQEQPIIRKAPGIGADGVGNYQGSLKLSKREPDKGVGGTGKIKLYAPTMRDQGEEFTGVLKARKPLKGGGSVSGKMWNNNEMPIRGREPSGSALAIGSYQGNMKPKKKGPGAEANDFPGKFKSTSPAMRDQGEEFTGFIKLPRFKKYYIKNPNSAEASLKKARPDKTTYQVDGLQVRVKQGDYRTKPHAAEGSLKGIAASKSSVKASEFSRVMRLKYDYIHNPSSAKTALKTREPDKAFGRASDYQGNVKMKKFEIFRKKELHPDAQFVRTNKNNVDEERSLLTNVKLFWAKLFGKDNLQPAVVRDKPKKPGYDKGEGQIWYNQHNTAPGGNSLRSNKTPEGN